MKYLSILCVRNNLESFGLIAHEHTRRTTDLCFMRGILVQANRMIQCYLGSLKFLYLLPKNFDSSDCFLGGARMAFSRSGSKPAFSANCLYRRLYSAGDSTGTLDAHCPLLAALQ